MVVTATVDGYKGDGMVVNMHVSCEYRALVKRSIC